MADFRMALQALGKGRVDDEVLRDRIRKLLQARPQLADSMLQQLKLAHEQQEIGREMFISLKEYIGSCAGVVSQTQLPQGGEAPTQTMGPATRAPQQPAGRAAPSDDGDEVSTEISAAVAAVEKSGSTAAGGTAPVASDWQVSDAEAAPMEGALGVGAVIKHRFKLLEEIGVGGMGKVFKGIDLLKQEAKDKNPYVAIKLLNEDFKQHPEAFIALQRESSRQQKLAHPNIATVYDFDRIGSSGTQVYITMELLEGEPLNKLIRREARARQGLPFEEAFPIIHGLGQALKYAHERNIAHSDFKPGNSFLCKDGTVKVLDFGIARAAQNPQAAGDGVAGGEKTLFDPGKLGALTPAYASLEMLQGDEPDTRDDIYALGCVAYELLAGKHPFNKLPANTARDNKLEVAPVKGLKRRQMRALQRSLAFERKDRSPSVDEFLEQLEGAIHWYKNPWAIAAIATVVLSLGATPVVLDYYRSKEIDALIAQVNTGESEQVLAVLAGFPELSEDERRRITEEARESLQSYFELRVALVANVAQERYDFPGAGRILDEAEILYPDSQWLKELRDQVEDDKNQVLYTTNKRYLGVLGTLQEGGADSEQVRESIKEVLALISRIDPTHPLLEDQRPSIAYLQLAEREFAEGLLQDALANTMAGRALDEENASLANLQVKIERRIRVGELETAIAGQPLEGKTLADYRVVATEALELARLAPSSQVLAELSAGVGTAAEASLKEVLANGTRADAEQLAAEFSGLLSALKLGRELSLIKLAHLEGAEREAAIQELVGGSQQQLDSLLAAAQPGDSAWESQVQANLQQLVSLLPQGEGLLDEIRARVGEVYVPLIDTAAEEQRFEEAKALLERITDIAGSNVAPLVDVGGRVVAMEEEFLREEQRKAQEAEIAGRKEDLLAQLRGLDLEGAQASISYLRPLLEPGDTFWTNLQQEIERAYTQKAARAAKDQQYAAALEVLAAGRKELPESALLARLEREYTGDFRAARAGEVVQRLLAAPTETGISVLLETRQDDLVWLQDQFPQRYAELRDDAASRFGQEIGRLRETDAGLASTLALGATTLFPEVESLQGLKASLEAQPWEGLESANTALAENRLSAVGDMLALAPTNNPDAQGLRTVLGERIQQAEQAYGSFRQARTAAGNNADDLRQSKTQLQQALALWSDNPDYLKDLQELDVLISRTQRPQIREKEKTIEEIQQEQQQQAAAEKAAPATGDARSPTRDTSAPAEQAGTDDTAETTEVAAVEPVAAPWVPTPSGYPCESRLAGYGKRAKAQCYDWIGDGVRGPVMVVVPASEAVPAGFAISKYEISVNDFNKFCFLSKSCDIIKEDKDYPIVNISVSQAEKYAQWLSERTGKTYRLPTKEEWVYAAEAGGKQPKKDFNCSVVLGEKKLKGTGLVSVKSGWSNGWGLNNYLGNAQEWVKNGGALNVRGGAFQDPLSNCEISLEREHDGSPDQLTGFRLLREEVG